MLKELKSRPVGWVLMQSAWCHHEDGTESYTVLSEDPGRRWCLYLLTISEVFD